MGKSHPDQEAVYKTLFERSPEGLVFCDPSSRILMVNDEFCLIFGYDRDEIVGKNLDEVVAQEASTLDEARELSEEYLQSGTFRGDAVRQKKDGSRFPVSIVTTPVVIDGTQTGSLTIYRDITEHRKREEEIRASEAKLRGILESHPELILRFTPDLVTTYANRAYCDYHGISCEDAIGKPFTHHVIPEQIPLVHSKLLALTPENSMVTGEEKVIRTSGETRWQEWTDKGIFDQSGKLIEIQSVGRDITYRKQMEEALAFERESLNLLFETAAEGIVLCEKDGTVVRANPMFCRMFGYSPDEAAGRNIDDLVASGTSMIDEARELTISTADGRSIASESTRRRKDGSTIDVSFLGVPIMMTGGVRFAYGIYRDISERKRAEEELLRLNRELFILATTDKVTGLLNRQHFEEIMQMEISKSCRYGTPLSLIMIDLDNFKQLNDTCGHIAGDRALAEIAGIIRGRTRISDLTARWGGDEFALASPTPPEHAAILAEKIRNLLLTLQHCGFGPVPGSFGVSSCRDGDSIESLTNRADELMYEVKRIGGNGVRSG
ncbi:MAG: hypothetical protein STSR0007_01880 [Thermovirga sp.]